MALEQEFTISVRNDRLRVALDLINNAEDISDRDVDCRFQEVFPASK